MLRLAPFQRASRSIDQLYRRLERAVGLRLPYPVRARWRRLLGRPPLVPPIRGAIDGVTLATPGSAATLRALRHDIICLPIIAWDFRFQRPQQLMRQFSRAGHRVFYVNPESARVGELAGAGASRPRVAPIDRNIFDVRLATATPRNYYREALDPANLEPMFRSLETLALDFGIVSAVAIVQLPFWGPLALRLRDELGWRLVYDCMDDHGDFVTNDPAMLAQEEELIARSDHVIVTSRRLLEKTTGRAHAVTLVPNACDFEHFSVARDTLAPPPELTHVSHPMVGYYGAISEWFDFALLRHAVDAHSEWSFVLIGSTWGAQSHDDLIARANVHFLGEKPYAELPRYLSQMDVTMIPFRLKPLILATNPVKFFEYLAAGKPVVASEIPELKHHPDMAYFARSPEEFTSTIERALSDSSPARAAERVSFAAENTWEKRHASFARAAEATFGRASVIVVTWNNLELTKLSLQSVLADHTWPNLELIVVDNGSADGTVAYLGDLAAREPRVKLILNRDNRGFAAASNLGIATACGDYVVLLNNDTVVTRGWLGRLIRMLEADKRIGLVGPVSNSVWNEARQGASYRNPEELADFAEQWARDHRGRLYPIKVLLMYCVAARRQVIDQVGPLDERFGIGMFEDDDYAHRVRAAGYRIVCAEEIFIHHAGSASIAKLSNSKYMALYAENQRKYEEKWGVTWRPHRIEGGSRAETLHWRERVEKILADQPTRKGVVIFPETRDWRPAGQDRSHQLALKFARIGYLVFLCSEAAEPEGGFSLSEVEPGLVEAHVPYETFENVTGAIVIATRGSSYYAAYFPCARVIIDSDDSDMTVEQIIDALT